MRQSWPAVSVANHMWGRLRASSASQYFYSALLEVKSFCMPRLCLCLCQSLFAPQQCLVVAAHRVVMVTFMLACGSLSLLRHLPHTHLLAMGLIIIIAGMR